jgi:hypothetical protein
VGLDLDATRLEAHERERDRTAEHAPTVRPKPSPRGDGFVSRA